MIESSTLSNLAALQPLLNFVSFVLALLLGAKALSEYRIGNRTRRSELRWRQAEMAKKLVDECWNDRLAQSALTMIDWKDRSYAIGSRMTDPITTELMAEALSAPRAFTADEAFVRDAFDALGTHMSRAHHFIDIQLICWEDIQEWWRYYIEHMGATRPRIIQFLKAYGYPSALQFIDRFQSPTVG